MSGELHGVLWCICILHKNNFTSNQYNKCLCQETIYQCFLSHLLKIIGCFRWLTSLGWILILFTAPWKVLHFGFLTTTVWISQGYFSCCWAWVTQHLGILLLILPLHWVGWAIPEVKWGHSQEIRPQQTHTYIMFSHKTTGGERRGTHSELWPSSSHVTVTSDESLFFPEMAKYLPDKGKQWINSFFCFACMKDLFYQCASFYLNPWVSPVFCWKESEQAAVWSWAVSKG